MSAVISDPPTVEIQDRLKRMGCELTTNPLLRTQIAFKHRRHVADVVISVLSFARYVSMLVCFVLFVDMARYMRRSEYYASFV